MTPPVTRVERGAPEEERHPRRLGHQGASHASDSTTPPKRHARQKHATARPPGRAERLHCAMASRRQHALKLEKGASLDYCTPESRTGAEEGRQQQARRRTGMPQGLALGRECRSGNARAKPIKTQQRPTKFKATRSKRKKRSRATTRRKCSWGDIAPAARPTSASTDHV